MAAATTNRLWRERRGSVALEVALLFPIAVVVLVGFAELYFYVRAVTIIERVTFTMADTVAKRISLVDCTQQNSSAYLGTHLLAAELTAQPLGLASQGQVIVSGVTNVNDKPHVAWQRRSTYTLGARSALGGEGAQPTLPGKLAVSAKAGAQADTLIVAEVFYRFQPFAGIRTLLPDLPAEITIERTAYSRARLGSLATLGTLSGCSGLPKP